MAAGRRDSRVKEIRGSTRLVLLSRRRPGTTPSHRHRHNSIMDYDTAPLPHSDKRNSGTTTPVEVFETSGPLYPPRSLAPPPAKLNEVLMSRRAWTPTFLPPTVRLFFVGAIVSTSGFLYGFDTGEYLL